MAESREQQMEGQMMKVSGMLERKAGGLEGHPDTSQMRLRGAGRKVLPLKFPKAGKVKVLSHLTSVGNKK